MSNPVNKKNEKLIKVKALSEVYFDDEMHAAGSILEVPESLANDWCKPIKTLPDFSGERATQGVTHHKVLRAERVAN